MYGDAYFKMVTESHVCLKNYQRVWVHLTSEVTEGGDIP